MAIDWTKYRNGPGIRDEINAHRERRATPCRHLGRRLRAVDVPGCCGTSVTVSLHACGVHHRCSVDVRVGAEAAASAGLPPLHDCLSCDDWSAADNSC